MIVLQPGNIHVVSMRLEMPYRGIWHAELQLDPDLVALAPSSGKVTITILDASGATATLVGTVDPRGTGAFAGLYHMRVLGGGGGWEQDAPRQFWASDGGVLSPVVYPATGALVGEVVTVLVPRVLGNSFTRLEGRASRVLDREASWWVDPTTGVTMVGPRPPALPDASMTLLAWDAASQVATLTCAVIVLPGTPIVDERIGAAPVLVRDVEQVFDSRGSTVTAWCSASAETQLATDLRWLVQEFSGVRFARSYLYRVAGQLPDGRLALQALDTAVPDMTPVKPWSGIPGATAKLTPGSIVRASFPSGDPGQVVVDLFDDTKPIQVSIDAEVLVQLAGGAAPVALAPAIVTFLGALQTWAAAVAGALSSAGFPITAAQAALVTAIGTAQTSTPALKTHAA